MHDAPSPKTPKYKRKTLHQKRVLMKRFNLPRLDLNQNQLIQSQSCYRYTTGQSSDALASGAGR